VPKTLLAVDDSATMRKVLEITFGGDDFRVVTAASAQAALAKMSEEPSIVLIDTLLGSDDGYALCSEIRRRDPSATIVLLASRHNPYDAAKGRDAGADDFMDKPFDTQQMVDKVKKAAATREGGAVAAVPPPQTAAAPPPASVQRPPAQAASPAPPPAAATPAAAQRPGPAAALPPERSRARLMFGDRGTPGGPAAPTADPRADAPREATPQPPAATSGHTKPSAAIYPPSRPQPAPAPKPAVPAPHAGPPAAKPAPAAAAAHAASANVSSGVSAGVNGQLAVKLGELGLSQQQVEAVMALSREVVEKVVWEVVPQLAETLIKEEIDRLTKEG
jgi:CheY-like chemotaxis protein